MTLKNNPKQAKTLESKLESLTSNEYQKRFAEIISFFELPKFDLSKINIPTIGIAEALNTNLLETFQKLGNIAEGFKNNPELQFAFITDLEILNLNSTEELKESLISDLPIDDLSEKERLLDKNLLPYLERLELDSLWIGAGFALNSESNPDRFRHCLISLRTILEYLIDEKLAPMQELMHIEMFKDDFRRYHLGKKELYQVKIYKDKKIEYFISKINFGVLEDFAKKDIDFICNCYNVLCNVHRPKIELTENQIRSLKVKTGITIWLLAYINEILEN